jgi:hypothetical protein
VAHSDAVLDAKISLPPEEPQMKYRAKPIIVEAFQWYGEPLEAWPDWVDRAKFWLSRSHMGKDQICMQTLDGQELCANHGDWIIRSAGGVFFPCPDDLFHMRYEAC